MPDRSKEMVIGRRIVAWRQRRGLSQATVSRRAGLNQSYLSRLESGKIQPTLRTVQRVATALRTPLTELLGPAPPTRTERPCPVSRGGQCLMDLVDTGAEFTRGDGPERYSSRQLRLIRRFTALVGRNERKMLTAFEVLIGRVLEDGNDAGRASKKKVSTRSRRPR